MVPKNEVGRRQFNVVLLCFRSSQKSKGSRTGFDKVTKITVMIFLSFLLGMLPYVIVTIVDKYQELPLAHIMSYVFVWMFYNINPIIYTSMDKNFRAAFIHLSKKIPCFLTEEERQRRITMPRRGSSLDLKIRILKEEMDGVKEIISTQQRSKDSLSSWMKSINKARSKSKVSQSKIEVQEPRCEARRSQVSQNRLEVQEPNFEASKSQLS